MSDKIGLKGTVTVAEKLDGEFTPDAIEREPMLFGADWYFALSNAGPITRAFMDKIKAGIEGSEQYFTLDSRSHMLMPGWYPCIPGWHLDLIPRSEGGQPDLTMCHTNDRHYLCVVDCGTGSLTEFLDRNIEVQQPKSEEIIYNSFNTQIDRMIHRSEVKVEAVPSGAIVFFGPRDIHRGVEAKSRGWRFFVRASITAHRKAANKIRRQAQVYIPAPKLEAGW